MRIRPLSSVLLAAGLTIGSLADPTPAREPARANGRAVLAADLHVHAFPGDGVLPIWELRKEAARRGLDVIVITNHNQSLAASLPAGIRRDGLPLVIRGVEITTPSFHLIAAGVRGAIDWRLPLRQTIDAVHSQGGVAIAAHPVKRSWRAGDDEALGVLDGAEAVHVRGQEDPQIRRELLEFYRHARQRNPALAAIGSSDFHGVAPLGTCRTYIVADEVSEEGVLRAIRRGSTAASDDRGTFVGDPALVALAQQSAEARRAAPRSNPWSQLAVAMVLSALLLLVCLE